MTRLCQGWLYGKFCIQDVKYYIPLKRCAYSKYTRLIKVSVKLLKLTLFLKTIQIEFVVGPFSLSSVGGALEATWTLLLCCNKSLDGGGGFAAVVGAKSRGSLSFRDTFLPTMSTSLILNCKILAIRAEMY